MNRHAMINLLVSISQWGGTGQRTEPSKGFKIGRTTEEIEAERELKRVARRDRKQAKIDKIRAKKFRRELRQRRDQ